MENFVSRIHRNRIFRSLAEVKDSESEWLKVKDEGTESDSVVDREDGRKTVEILRKSRSFSKMSKDAANFLLLSSQDARRSISMSPDCQRSSLWCKRLQKILSQIVREYDFCTSLYCKRFLKQ